MYLLSLQLLFCFVFASFSTFYPFNSIFISKAIINTQWLRKRRIPTAITKLQFKDSRLRRRKCIFKYSCATQRTTAVPYCTLTPQSPFSRVGCGAAHGPQPRQDHLPLAVQVALGARVQALHQELLVEQRVVRPECAGRVVVELVVVAKLRLPDGRDVLIHMHLAAQGHHDKDANEARRWWVGLNLLLSVLLDNVPKLPYKFRMKNIKWLIWVSLAMLNIWSEQVVIWLLVPQV